MSAEYSLAMSEVLCIINQSDDNYKSKIPQSFISFLKENADPTYNPNFDVTIPLKELDLRKETKGLLALIHRSYICNDEERAEYDKILKENEKKAQRILNEKYDVYKIFDSRQNKSLREADEIDNSSKAMVKYKKENIFIKIINKIKNMFKRR